MICVLHIGATLEFEHGLLRLRNNFPVCDSDSDFYIIIITTTTTSLIIYNNIYFYLCVLF